MFTMDTKEIIAKAGGARVLAESLGVSTQAVYDWRKIPAKHVFKVAKLAQLEPEKIKPEMFA